jgi:hypothetical protein
MATEAEPGVTVTVGEVSVGPVEVVLEDEAAPPPHPWVSVTRTARSTAEERNGNMRRTLMIGSGGSENQGSLLSLAIPVCQKCAMLL